MGWVGVRVGGSRDSFVVVAQGSILVHLLRAHTACSTPVKCKLTRRRHLPRILCQQRERAAHAARRERRQPRAARPRALELLMDARDALLQVGSSG